MLARRTTSRGIGAGGGGGLGMSAGAVGGLQWWEAEYVPQIGAGGAAAVDGAALVAAARSVGSGGSGIGIDGMGSGGSNPGQGRAGKADLDARRQMAAMLGMNAAPSVADKYSTAHLSKFRLLREARRRDNEAQAQALAAAALRRRLSIQALTAGGSGAGIIGQGIGGEGAGAAPGGVIALPRLSCPETYLQQEQLRRICSVQNVLYAEYRASGEGQVQHSVIRRPRGDGVPDAVPIQDYALATFG